MEQDGSSRSPILREQQEAEESVSLCNEIWKNSRNELYLSMRFLDVALSSLWFAPDMEAGGIGTDGSLLYFRPEALAALYRRGRVYVNRIYLHTVLHCLFCHLWTKKDRAEDFWNLACDIAVESILDGLKKPCVYLHPSPFRREWYGRLEGRTRVMNAESVYRALQDMNLSEQEYFSLCREFYRDDHSFWGQKGGPQQPNRSPNDEENWDDIRRKMQTEMEVFGKEASGDEKDLLDQLRIENRERYDYGEFLRKFSVLKETVQIDADAFDYIFYNYGMQIYGNMPLIEPLETKEVRRIEDFVVVIDTSMSCSGELVKKFLEETYTILSRSESFFRKVNLHILQCDDKVRQDVKIENRDQLRFYMDHLELHGLGGTDFRPAFSHVDRLLTAGAFDKLRGLIYFTDGYGRFPVKMPPYDTAFVFMKEDYTDVDVPPWAIKIILEPDQIGGPVQEG